MSQVSAVLQPRRLGHYNLIERLGVGGQSEVWQVSDEEAGATLALKILSPVAARSPEAWAALEREYAVSTLLRHPAILRVLAPERLDGYVVLPMELADGGDLSGLCGKGYLQIVPALIQVAGALYYAHAHGVVHRDLKPGNVLFDRSGQVKLADFGVAALLPESGAEQAIARAWGGSPFTMSPGQLRGEVPSAADDIYGFGTLAYELLSGRPPYYPRFDANEILTRPAPQLVPTRQAPVQLIELVMRLLAKSVEERPASMREVARQLEMTLNATLALDLTELADLSSGSGTSPFAVSVNAAEPRTPQIAGEQSPNSTAAVPQGPPEAVPQPLPQAPAAPAPIPMMYEPLSARECVNPLIEAMPRLRARRSPRFGDSFAVAHGRLHRGRHRLRYLLFGLVCGAVVSVGALQWLSRHDPPSSPLGILSAAVSRAAARHSMSLEEPIGALAPTSTAISGDSAVPSGLRDQRRQFDRRLHALAARGASVWDRSDFVAATTQAAQTRSAESAGDVEVARRHWHKAQELLSAVEAKAPRALAAALRGGENALVGARPKAAVQAFTLALRIDPGSRRAAEGLKRARVLEAVLPLLRDGQRAERARDYSRAVYYFRQVLAHDPGYAPARRGLMRVRSAFSDAGYENAIQTGLRALARGRLYHAQAAFLQALVFRPRGTEATKDLEEVNAALRRRAARP